MFMRSNYQAVDVSVCLPSCISNSVLTHTNMLVFFLGGGGYQGLILLKDFSYIKLFEKKIIQVYFTNVILSQTKQN